MTHKICETECVSHAFKRPCKDQDGYCRYHKFKPFRKAVHKSFKRYHFSRQVQNKHEKDSNHCGEDQARLCITSGKCGDHICRSSEISCIYHGTYCRYDKNSHRKNKIYHFAVRIYFILRYLFKLLCATCKKVSFRRIILMLLHQAEIKCHNSDKDYHKQGKDRVQVIRDCPQEKLKPRNSRILGHIRINCCRPARDRCDNTHRCSSGVDNICKLCP